MQYWYFLEVRGQPSASALTVSLVWGRLFCWALNVPGSLDCKPLGSLCLHFSFRGFALGLSISVGSQGSDSGACVASSLPIDPSSQHQDFFFLLKSETVFIFLCLGMFCPYTWLPHMCSDPWGQKRASYPLGLELQRPVSSVGGGKLDRCPLGDQPVPLATESALQAPIPSSFF